MKKVGLLLLLFILGKQFSFSQQVTITGTITSADDQMGIPGATVIVKGTSVGTAADIDGNFKLTIPSDAKTLVFSFVGMQPQEVQINGQTTFNIVMRTDVFKMEEVVVSGVASATPKKKLSVSVTKVSSDDLDKVPASSAATALQGKVSGITIVSGSGDPGQTAGIRLRSSTSLLGSQTPLIIVDGVMIDGEFSDINMDDVESIEVVKGAAASALYGSRAGSGVISVRTKRGSSSEIGKTDIKIRNEYGISSLAKEIKMSEHHQYMLADDYKQPGYTKYLGVGYPDGYNGGGDSRITGSRIEDYDHYADNPYSFVSDPQKEIFLTGSYYTNYASVSSRTEKTNFLLSFENYHNSGIVFNKKGINRQNFRANIDHKISEKIKISSTTLITDTKLDLPNGGESENNSGGPSSAFYDALFLNPDVNLNMNAPSSDTTLLTKYYIKPDNWTISGNPKHSLFYEERNTTRRSVIQNLNSNITIFKWLIFDLAYNAEKRDIQFTQYIPVGYMGASGTLKDGAELKQNKSGLSQNYKSTLNYNKLFGEFTLKGKLDYTFEKSEENWFWALGNTFLASGIRSMSALAKPTSIGSYEYKTIAKNYSGIAEFDYKGKYIASALYRRDGSSLFGANYRWNPYYRYSLAYRITEDIKIPNVQELKLHYATGASGQRPGLEFQYETFELINGQFVPSYSGNKNLRPSETQETEIGINAQFFEKFETEINYAVNSTTRAFVPVPLPSATGFAKQWRNAATIAGSSFEVSFSTQAIKSKDWEWRINLNYDKVTQKIEKLEVPAFSYGPLNAFYYKEGEVLGVMYGNEWVKDLGQMEKQLSTGDNINNYTVNSDGYVIVKGTEGTLNEKPLLKRDKTGAISFEKIADMNPDFNLSLNSNLSWKDLTFSMLWSLKSGGKVYNLTKQRLFLEKRAGEFDQSSKPGYKKKTVGYYLEFYDARLPNSYFVEDGTYLKLRELSLYYSLDRKIIKNKNFSFVKSAKFGVLARNLFTYTKYTGWDPEVASGDDQTNFVIDDFNYPNYRSFTFSLELKF